MGNDNSSNAPASASGNAGVSKGVKLVLLVVLCLQNAVYTMLRRYRCVFGCVGALRGCSVCCCQLMCCKHPAAYALSVFGR